MKKMIIIIFLAAITFIANAQTQWEPITIKEKLIASFPGKPEKKQNGPVETYGFYTADSTKALIINILDMGRLDSAQIQAWVEQDEFWEDIKQESYNSFKGMTNLTEEKITFLGKTARKFQFEGKKNENDPPSKFTVVSFFIGTDFYSIQFTNRKGLADKKIRTYSIIL